jgi:hypothetical protein
LGETEDHYLEDTGPWPDGYRIYLPLIINEYFAEEPGW